MADVEKISLANTTVHRVDMEREQDQDAYVRFKDVSVFKQFIISDSGNIHVRWLTDTGDAVPLQKGAMIDRFRVEVALLAELLQSALLHHGAVGAKHDGVVTSGRRGDQEVRSLDL